MSWAYRILFPLLLIPALPYYVWRMLRRGGYGTGFSQRLGFFPKVGPKTPGKLRYWIQAVSVGEIEAIGPLLKELKASGQVDLVLTTTTSTGYRLARERYAEVCTFIGIFPLDFWPCSALAYRRLQPSAIVLTEGELWPEHLGQARARKLPTLLINARLSDRSFARHQRFKGASRGLLAGFTWIGSGSEEDARRLMSLGAEPANIDVTGNLKFDVASDGPLSLGERLVLRQALIQSPDDLELNKDLVMAYTLKRDYARARESVVTLCDRPNADAICFQLAGNVFKALEEVKECEKYYKRGLKKFPNHGPLYSEYGELLWSTKDPRAIGLWENGIKVDPGYGGNYYNAALYYYYTTDKVWGLIYGEISPHTLSVV